MIVARETATIFPTIKGKRESLYLFILQEYVFLTMLFYLSLQVGTNMQTFVSSVNTFQPFLLRIREHNSSVQKLYIIVDKKAIKRNMQVSLTLMNSSKLTLYSAHHTVRNLIVALQQTSRIKELRYVYDGY